MPAFPGDEIRHRRLDPDGEEPEVQVAKHVADISGEEPDALETTWDAIGTLLQAVFSTPPAPRAQVEVTFTYEGYRISITQGGHATFVPVHEPAWEREDT